MIINKKDLTTGNDGISLRSLSNSNNGGYSVEAYDKYTNKVFEIDSKGKIKKLSLVKKIIYTLKVFFRRGV